MKICNVAMIGYNNFGNRLQNYAINNYLSKITNSQIYTLWNYEYLVISKNIIKYFLFSKRNSAKRFWNFYKFNNEFINKYYCNLKKFVYSKDKNIFDYFVVGSDQVWNYNYLSKFVNDGGFDLFLLKNIEGFKCVSYAPSLGVSEFDEEYRPYYENELNKFKSLSVREYAGKKIIEDLTHRTDIEVLIDPTMLLTSDEWDGLSKEPKQISKLKGKKYILNYFLGELSEQRKNEIKRVANDNDCEVINILNKNDPFYVSGPCEFLWLEKNAFLICTDSFHSSVFAILYDRPFIVFDREEKNIENMNSRIETLLDKFKLKNRKYNGINITKENLKHDYTDAYKILEKERKKSELFLKNAFDIEVKDEK